MTDRLGVTSFTALNWERAKTHPTTVSFPVILRFLAYDPFPESWTLSEHKLVKGRSVGWSIAEVVKQLGIDDATGVTEEQGKAISLGKHRTAIATFVALRSRTGLASRIVSPTPRGDGR